MPSRRPTRTPISTRWGSRKAVWLVLISVPTIFTTTTSVAQEPDPVPIQRIEIPPERLSAEMERVRRKVLTEMPRAQFEELVQRAARAEAAGKSPPRLVEAAYRATFSESGLAGSAQWKVAHDVDVPGRLPLSTMQLALRSGRWSDRAPVVLGVLDNRAGAGLELLVEGKGERTLSLEWSARGLPEPGAQRFELRLPACAVTTFDLDLPADHRPQVDRDEVVLSGPIAADKAGYQRWRFSFPRSTGAGLTVRLSVLTPRSPSQPPPLLRTSIQTTQKLLIGQVECEFQIDVQTQRGGVRKLNLDLAPELRVLEVQAPDMEGWGSATSAGGSQIEVRWVEPFRGGRLVVRAIAPMPSAAQRWTSPGIQVADAVPRGEKLTLLVHPDLELDSWNSGGFQFISGPTASGSMRAVTLESQNMGPDAGKRPEARIRAAAGRVQTRESWVWRLDSQQSTLTIDLRISARRGFASPQTWQVPSGWEVKQVESSLPNSDLRWNVSPSVDGKPGSLSIDLGREPSSATDEIEHHLAIRLHGPGISWVSSADGPSATLEVPQFRPEPDVSREGTLTVRLSPTLAQIASGGRSLRADQTVPFRGAPEGEIQVRPRRGRFQARCDIDVTMGNRRYASYKLELTPATSASEEVLLFVSAPVAFDSWRTLTGGVELRGIEPILNRSVSEALWPFGATQGWDFLGRWAAARVAAGSWWRLTFDRRLQNRMSIELRASLPDHADQVEVPLLVVAGADSFDGKVVVRSVPRESLRIATTGISNESVPDDHDGWARRAFSYRAPPFGLNLTASPQTVPVQESRAEQAILIAQPTNFGQTLHRFRFRLAGWPASELPVTMPAGSEMVSIRVNGVVVAAPNLRGGQDSLALPWNPARPASDVDIVYALPSSPLSSFNRLQAMEPALPVPMELRRIWRLPAGVVAVALNGLSPAGPTEFEDSAPIGWTNEPSSAWIEQSARAASASDAIWVARSWALLITGLIASLIPLALAAIIWRGRRLMSAVELLATGLGVIWLPTFLWWVLFPALLSGLLLFAADAVYLFRKRASNQIATTESMRTGAAVASLLICAAAAIRGIAGSAEVSPVYLIPGLTPGMQTALVPPDLIESLRTIIHRGEPTATVILQSRYDGEVVGSSVRWSAQLEAFHCSEGFGPITIALPEVQLLSAEIDHRPALPRVSDEGGRFTFDLNGRGVHPIVLKFQTSISGDAERDTRFTIPEAPICSCSVQLPASASDFQAIGARGAQQIGGKVNRPRIDVDLGRIGSVHIRWRQPSAAAAVRPTVQAAHLWEISEASERLQSVFRIRFGAAGPRGVEFDIPPELELADVQSHQVDDPTSLLGPIALREWRCVDVAGKRRHHLEFQMPLAGQVQLELELVPRQMARVKPSLAFPELVGDFDCESTAAVRLQNLRAQLVDAKGWERMGPEEFLHAIWQPLRVDVVDREPDFAFRHHHTPTPTLQIELRRLESTTVADQQINWRVGPGRAQLQATARRSDLPIGGLVEWEVPAAITITDVHGDGLRHWSRAGSRLQAWFESRASDRSVGLTLLGFMPRAIDESDQEKTPFVAPLMRQLGIGRQSIQLTVQANDGWRLEAQENRPFRVFPTTDLPGVRWSGFAESPAAAAFVMRRAEANVQGDILTLIESSNRSFAWSATVDLQLAGDIRSGKVQTIMVEARRVDGERPRISLPPGMRLRDSRLGVRGMTWVIDGLPGRHRLSVSGRFTAGQGQSVEAPHVSLSSAADANGRLRRWLALGAGVQPRDVTGVQPASIPVGLDPRPELERTGTLGWAISTDAWSLRIDESVNEERAAASSEIQRHEPNDAASYYAPFERSETKGVASREVKGLESLALIVVLAVGLITIARIDRRRAVTPKDKSAQAQL